MQGDPDHILSIFVEKLELDLRLGLVGVKVFTCDG